MDERMYCPSNDPFQSNISGDVNEKSAFEGDFPHLLPLKEGGEETLSFPLLDVCKEKTNTILKYAQHAFKWCISHPQHSTRCRALHNARASWICTDLALEMCFRCDPDVRRSMAGSCVAQSSAQFFCACGDNQATSEAPSASSKEDELNDLFLDIFSPTMLCINFHAIFSLAHVARSG